MRVKAIIPTTGCSDLRNFRPAPKHVFNNSCEASIVIVAMDNLMFCILVQLNLVFGVAGLIWPDKLKPLFGVLMFPWPASYRAIRVNGIVAIGAYFLVLGKLLVTAQ
jgi:hypothetical protein